MSGAYAGSESDSAADACNREGLRLFKSGKHSAAKDSLRRSLKHKPSAEAHGNLAFALHAGGAFSEALAHCERALKLRPDYAEGHRMLGHVLYDMGTEESGTGGSTGATDVQAESHLRKALSLQPNMRPAKAILEKVLRRRSCGIAGSALESSSSPFPASSKQPQGQEEGSGLLKVAIFDTGGDGRLAAESVRAALECGWYWPSDTSQKTDAPAVGRAAEAAEAAEAASWKVLQSEDCLEEGRYLEAWGGAVSVTFITADDIVHRNRLRPRAGGAATSNSQKRGFQRGTAASSGGAASPPVVSPVVDVLIMPGGFACQQSMQLGRMGRQKVRMFVAAGGGYVGICAGAYLACAGYKPEVSLGLLDVDVLIQPWACPDNVNGGGGVTGLQGSGGQGSSHNSQTVIRGPLGGLSDERVLEIFSVQPRGDTAAVGGGAGGPDSDVGLVAAAAAAADHHHGSQPSSGCDSPAASYSSYSPIPVKQQPQQQQGRNSSSSSNQRRIRSLSVGRNGDPARTEMEELQTAASISQSVCQSVLASHIRDHAFRWPSSVPVCECRARLSWTAKGKAAMWVEPEDVEHETMRRHSRAMDRLAREDHAALAAANAANTADFWSAQQGGGGDDGDGNTVGEEGDEEETLGEDTCFMRFHNGPLMSVMDRSQSLPHSASAQQQQQQQQQTEGTVSGAAAVPPPGRHGLAVLATFDCDAPDRVSGRRLPIMRGAAAAVSGCYGEGGVVLISPHPEGTAAPPPADGSSESHRLGLLRGPGMLRMRRVVQRAVVLAAGSADHTKVQRARFQACRATWQKSRPPKNHQMPPQPLKQQQRSESPPLAPLSRHRVQVSGRPDSTSRSPVARSQSAGRARSVGATQATSPQVPTTLETEPKGSTWQWFFGSGGSGQKK